MNCGSKKVKIFIGSTLAMMLIFISIAFPLIFQLQWTSYKKNNVNQDHLNDVTNGENTTMTSITTTDDNSLSCGRFNKRMYCSINGPVIAMFAPLTWTKCCNWCLGTPKCAGFNWGWANNSEEKYRLVCDMRSGVARIDFGYAMYCAF